jgi:hypothetical protein
MAAKCKKKKRGELLLRVLKTSGALGAVMN